MWGYYLPVTAGDLGSALTDAQGLRHAGSVPSGQVRADVSEAFTQRLAGLIPPYFLDLTERTARTSIQAIEPVAEPNEKNLISEIPDLASLSPQDTYSWLSAIHPGANITLP